MRNTLSLLILTLGILGIIYRAQGQVTYTFASRTAGPLTVSTTPGAAGNQDGWYSDGAVSGAFYVAAGTGIYSGSKVIQQSGASSASHAFRLYINTFFSPETRGANARITFLLGAPSSSCGFALTGNATETATRSDASHTRFSPYVSVTAGTGRMVASLSPLGTTGWGTPVAQSVTAVEGHYYTVQLAIDFMANGGDGAGTLSYQDVTAGGPWTTFASIQNVDLGLTHNAAGYKYTEWNQVWLTGLSTTAPYTAVEGFSITGTPTNLLSNPGLEVPYNGFDYVNATTSVTGEIASGWKDNSTWAQLSASYAQDTGIHHGGSSSQKITVSSVASGAVQFVQQVNLIPGHFYHASAWLRAAAPTTVTLLLRQGPSPYATYVSQQVALTTSWQEAHFVGMGEGSTYFMLQIGSPATVWIDDAFLGDLTPPLSVAPIPGTYFGMHIVNDTTNAIPWPTSHVGTWRLWDAGVRWLDLEPSSGQWNFTVLDNYVALAAQKGAQIIMTLGQTPSWAAPTGAPVGVYGPGASSAPTDIATWNTYVTELATRYKGKIHYWEIWNEPNVTAFWCGTTSQMVALAQSAYQILKQVDPTNQIISPSPSGDPSLFLPGYIAAGGGAYCDIIGYHFYVDPYAPETMLTPLSRILQLTYEYHLSRPIWNTEQGWFDGVTDDATASAYIGRAYLLTWAYGIPVFGYYYWNHNPNADSISLTGTDNATLTPAGVAQGNVEDWLLGATMTDVSYDGDGNGTWNITLTRPGGYLGHVLWNPSQTASYSIPPAWGVITRRTLDGATASQTVPTLSVGAGPVLLQNQ